MQINKLVLIFLLVSFQINCMDDTKIDESVNAVGTSNEQTKVEVESESSQELERKESPDSLNEPGNSPSRLRKCFNFCSTAINPKIVLKSLTYRIFAACGSATVAYAVTGDIGKSLQIAGFNSAIATVLYYTYDRIWIFCDNKVFPICIKKCRKK